MGVVINIDEWSDMHCEVGVFLLLLGIIVGEGVFSLCPADTCVVIS